jgi:hypothetical protein
MMIRVSDDRVIRLAEGGIQQTFRVFDTVFNTGLTARYLSSGQGLPLLVVSESGPEETASRNRLVP